MDDYENLTTYKRHDDSYLDGWDDTDAWENREKDKWSLGSLMYPIYQMEFQDQFQGTQTRCW